MQMFTIHWSIETVLHIQFKICNCFTLQIHTVYNLCIQSEAQGQELLVEICR